MKKRCPRRGKSGFSVRALILCGILGFMLLPAPARAQTGGNTGGPAARIPVAVLPLAGENKEMVERFYQGILESVILLEKYTPRPVPLEIFDDTNKIPTALPPHQNLVAGARYALTGGVYPGTYEGEYYLQLWLWDMSGSTMIYTDDLTYEDVDDAMTTLPGLVEWLFDHIHEFDSESSEAKSLPDPIVLMGFRAGISPRGYISPGEPTPGAWALGAEGALFGSFRINSLLALQFELILAEDTVVYRGLNTNDEIYNVKYRSLSLMVPLLLRMDFRPGPLRFSPLAGLYGVFPLGDAHYYSSTEGVEDASYSSSYSFSVPLGFTLGFETAIRWGPGEIFADLRYNGDLGMVNISGSQEIKYKRHIFSITLGYAWGFLVRSW